MKKLLGILSSIAVTATAATSVVACTVPTTNIDVSFQGDNAKGFKYDDGSYTFGTESDNSATYTKDQLDTAMNGNFAIMNQQFPVAMSFDQLNQSLLNLISFNQSLVVKTQQDLAQLRNFRDTFLGRDSDTVNSDKGIDTPSVDGIKFNKVDDNNYYGGFQKTDINSLTGLWDLYNYVHDKNGMPVLGASANADVQKANDLFDNNPAAKEIMKNFANSKHNPAFTAIKYDLPLTIYHSQSQYIDGFASNKKAGNTGDQSLGLQSSAPSSYLSNNTDVSMETSTTTKQGKKTVTTTPSNRITDHGNSDPYAAIVIDPSGNGGGDIKGKENKSFQIDSGLRNLTEVKQDDSNKVLREYFTNDSDNTPVYYYVGKDKDNSVLNQNIGEYMVKKVDPFTVHYTYKTDVNEDKKTDNKDSKTFNISMKLNNLSEIYSPYMTSVNATSLASVENKDNKTAIFKFNKSITGVDKELTGLTITNGDNTITPTDHDIQSDGTIKLDMDLTKKTTVTFKPQNIDKDGKKTTSDNQLSYKEFTADKGKTVSFTTSQLVWIFRGYKFLNYNNLTKGDNSEIDGKVFVDQQKSKGKSTGAPLREGALLADITHNLRDMQSSDWVIKQD